MKRPIEDILIPEAATVLDAIKAIDRGAVQAALVVDANRRLLGTVTDGDVRRGLLRGLNLDAPVRDVMRRDPTTISVTTGHAAALKLMQERKFHQIPVVDDAGRVVGLELVDDIIAMPTSETWVVLMAGGKGVRLRPLTEAVPKPMLPIGGRPLLETILHNLMDQGFGKFFISVNHQRHVIQDHFGDGSKMGVSINYLVEDKPLGTAGSLSLLPERPADCFIVMNADLMTSIQFDQLLRFHVEHGSDATLCVREHITEIPFGVVEIDGIRLLGIVEKPKHSFRVNAGIYVLSPSVLDHVPEKRSCDMPDVFASVISAGGNASVFPIREYWLDVGRFEDLQRAEAEFGNLFPS